MYIFSETVFVVVCLSVNLCEDFIFSRHNQLKPALKRLQAGFFTARLEAVPPTAGLLFHSAGI